MNAYTVNFTKGQELLIGSLRSQELRNLNLSPPLVIVESKNNGLDYLVKYQAGYLINPPQYLIENSLVLNGLHPSSTLGKLLKDQYRATILEGWSALPVWG
jgi:hypothetical protein